MTATQTQRSRVRDRIVTSLRWRVLDPQHTDCLVRDVRRPVRPVTLPDGYVARTVTDRDDPDVALLPRDRHHKARRSLAAGDICHLVVAVAADGTERAAAWTWWTTRSHRDHWSGIRVTLLPNESFSYDLFVSPLDRRNGLGRYVMSAMLHHAAQVDGIEYVYEVVEKSNRESQTLNRMVFGFRRVQDVRNYCLFNRFGVALAGSVTPPGGPLSASRTLHLPTPSQPAPPASDG